MARDDGFERVHQQGFLGAAAAHLLAAAQFEIAADIEAARHAMQMGRAHQVRLQARKLAFALVGKAPDQSLGHQKAEHRIAQKLELLVVARVARRPVRISLASELWVSARRSNSALENW